MEESTMDRIITDALMDQARDFTNNLTREERAAIFNDRMLEDQAGNTKYMNGQSIKDVVDGIVQTGGLPSFKQKDIVGRAYAKMVTRRLSQ